MTVKGRLLGIEAVGERNGSGISQFPCWFLRVPRLHYFQEAFVFLRHTDQIVAGCRLKEVVSDFSFLCISFFNLEMIWAGHDFTFVSMMM